MPKAPKELQRYDESGTGAMWPVPFASAIEDAIIGQVHIWILRRLQAGPQGTAVEMTLKDLQEWLGRFEGDEKLKDLV
jgi:hypothetical protein